MRYACAILPLLLLLSLWSCEPKEEVFTSDPGAVLAFSADTVLFDTVFVSRGSVTKRLKVYNRNKNAVRIGEVRLAGAAASAYQLTVNGVQSPLRSNLELRGGDSLYVLVQVNINPSDQKLPFLVADSILFLTNGRRQQVKLVAYGQNAYFHRKETIGTTIWAGDKPHVLLDSIRVQEGATLTIQQGARIYAVNKAALLVAGQLLVEGTPKERVIFSGYRREPDYQQAPGQWEGIRILKQSAHNSFRYADIRNAVHGLHIENPGKGTTLVEGCKVQYAFADGILALSSDVKLVNTLIHNCGQHGFAGLGGGTYEILYSTIASYGNALPRKAPLLAIADFIPATGVKERPTSLRLLNTIVYSESHTGGDEVYISPEAATSQAENNLLRTTAYQALFTAKGNKLNIAPKFKAPAKADFRLDTLSPASGAAKMLPAVPLDLNGSTRSTTAPDMGAYERTVD